MKPDTKTTILDWYATGEKGISSETMAAISLGKSPRDFGYPHDPADLNRCIKLVDIAPEVKDAFHQISASHERWKIVIDHWDELRKMFINEVGYDWSKARKAPKTYDRMKELGI